jgi:NADP-dependent aldehyde dehydrogenase
MTDTAPEQLDRVLDAAVAAAVVLRDRTPAERARHLHVAADALDAAAGRLLPLAEEESHLPLPRLTGELKRTTFQLRLLADEIASGAFLHATVDHADPGWGMGPRPDLRRMLVPLGPVAVWAASNFPFAFSVAGGDTASALAAGCPVVLVAHPGHPRLSEATAEVLVAALEGAGAPTGVFALVEGREAGRALITDPRIAAGAFTGSLRGGRTLFDLASARETPIPFYGELGSVNPAFVTASASSARAEAIAEGFAASMTLGAGQFCTKPGLLFVPADSPIPGLVAERLRAAAAAPMLNDRIREGYGQALRSLAAHEVVDVLAGTVDPDTAPAPTLLRTSAAEVLADPRPLTAEVFGPAALVVEYADEEQLLDAVRVLEGQLTATVQGEPDDAVVPALLALLTERAGRVLWGGWPTGVTVSYAQQHGGPYPATTAIGTTSVGTAAIERFLRPVAYQDLPESLLPEPLQDANPWSVPQRVDGIRHP